MNMMKTLDVVAAIIERDGKILLAQRPLHADQSGMWELAGGKVEPGENQPEALIRELPVISARFQADLFTYMPGMCRRIKGS